MFPLLECFSTSTPSEGATDGAADHEEEEEPQEGPTMTETPKMLRLLPNKVNCSGGDQKLMRCIEQLKNVFLGPVENAKQASITLFSFPL